MVVAANITNNINSSVPLLFLLNLEVSQTLAARIGILTSRQISHENLKFIIW